MVAWMCLAFGTLEQPVVWAAEVEDCELEVGARTDLGLMTVGPDGDPEVTRIVSQVIMAETREDGVEVGYLFAGEEAPDEITEQRLSDGDWTRLEDEDALRVMELVMSAPPTASMHDLLLVIGEEDPQVWALTLEPEDPLLPMFGQRITLDALGAEVDETTMPALVIYSALVEAGVGEAVFWVDELTATVDGFDLLAAGWELLDEDEFDASEFRLGDRIRVARAVELTLEVDEDGDTYLTDFAVHDAESIPADCYELLPEALAEYCQFAAEVASNSDAMLEEWRRELEGGSSAA